MNEGSTWVLGDSKAANHVHFLPLGSDYDLSGGDYDLYEVNAEGLGSRELVHRIGQVLPFPEWSGANWAALEDSLASWEDWREVPSNGVVLVIRGFHRLTMEVGNVIEIWESVASEYWAPEGRPLHLVLEVAES